MPIKTPSNKLDQYQDKNKFQDKYWGRVPMYLHMIPETMNTDNSIYECNPEYIWLIEAFMAGTIEENNLSQELYQEIVDTINKIPSYGLIPMPVVDPLFECIYGPKDPDLQCSFLVDKNCHPIVGSDACYISSTDKPLWNYTYWADEELDRILGVDMNSMALEKNIALDPSEHGYAAGSCDRAGYTSHMYVSTPKVNHSWDPTPELQVVNVNTGEWVQNIPVKDPPRSSGGYNPYLGIQGITGKKNPYAMLIHVNTNTQIAWVGSERGVSDPSGNDGGSATGHFIWLDKNHFGLLDRFADSIFVYRVDMTGGSSYRITQTDVVQNATSCHSLISKDGAGHQFSEKIFYGAIEGSQSLNVTPKLVKYEFDSNTGKLDEIGRIDFGDVGSGGLDSNFSIHHFGIKHDSSLIAVPFSDKTNSPQSPGIVLLVDPSTMTLLAAHPTAITAGCGAGHADFSKELNRVVITNHKDDFVTIIDLNTFAASNVSFTTSGTIGDTFIQSHRNWVINDGREYVFWNAVEGVFYKIDLITHTIVGSLVTGGTPVQSTS